MEIHDVLWPLGRKAVDTQKAATRLPDLSGKTVGELWDHIQAAVDTLPDIYRTVFVIRDVEGLSTEETAELLGISVPTVKTRLHRARIALRDAIGGYFKTGE